MPLQIIRNDITKVKADVIVNTANPEPVIGGGTEAAIYEAAGADQLLAARQKIGDIEVGEAFETPAFNLDAKFIIHTCGPIWEKGAPEECKALKKCYLNSLKLADQYKCRSIAFPLISSGTYGFPKKVALEFARAAINEFLEDHEMDVYLIVFDDESLVASKAYFKEIEEYIDSEYASRFEGNRVRSRLNRRERAPRNRSIVHHNLIQPDVDDILQLISGKQMHFKDVFFYYMDKKGMQSTDVYSDYFGRKTFNKIQNVPDYHPSKGTAIQACLGLKLTLAESEELLASASYAFNPYFHPDKVIMFCIDHQMWSLRDINYQLDKCGLPEFNNIY